MIRDFDRYIVFKTKHVREALTIEEQNELYRLQDKLARWRLRQGKEPLECVIVEHDWPEYEPVWSMIEARVDSTSEDLVEFNNGWRHASHEFYNTERVYFIRGITPYCKGFNAFMHKVSKE